MKIHLHLLRPESNSASSARPRLAMTEFWLGGSDKSSTTVTFGSGLETDDCPWHQRIGEANPGLRGLAVLFLRARAPGGQKSSLKGELAHSLAEVLGDLHAKDNSSKPTWLQSIFGLPSGKRVSGDCLKATDSVHRIIRLGRTLESAEFAVFVHTTAAEVLGARCLLQDARRTGKGARKAAVSHQTVPPEQFTALADELEGEVDAKLRVAIQKKGRGSFVDPEHPSSSTTLAELLPLRSEDIFQLTVTASPKAFLYLVWIDSVGAQTPLFPWSPEKGWDDITAESRNQARGQLTLLDDIADILAPDSVLESFGIAGAETFVLLAHGQKLELPAVRNVFDALPQPKVPLEAVTFRYPNRLERLPLRRNPEPIAKDAKGKENNLTGMKQASIGKRKAPDGLDELNNLLSQALQFRVDVAFSFVVPSLGGPKPDSQH